MKGTRKKKVWEMNLFLESKEPIVHETGKARAEAIALWTPPPGMADEPGKIYWRFDGEAPQAVTEADVAPLREQLKAAMCATPCKNHERLMALEKARDAVYELLGRAVGSSKRLIGDQEWETLWYDTKVERMRLAAAKKDGRDPVERSFGRDGKILGEGAGSRTAGQSRAHSGHKRHVPLQASSSGLGSRSGGTRQRLKF